MLLSDLTVIKSDFELIASLTRQGIYHPQILGHKVRTSLTVET